ncbi:hypothetical protein KAT84_02795 [Candidatus Bipolaricaulota bacterium]|nr:hypothetical protein [Candidatus Bipolaricaulota bacterium]
MKEFEQQVSPTPSGDKEMNVGYKQAIEKAITHLPVKNGVINIDSIWVATSIPYEILNEVLRQDGLVLPDNVDRINLKSNVRTKEQTRPSRRRRRKKPRAKG